MLMVQRESQSRRRFLLHHFKKARIATYTPMMVTFELDGKKLMGLNGGSMHQMNPAISMFVQTATLAECTRIWNGLSEGAKVLMPLDKYPWSEQYGCQL